MIHDLGHRFLISRQLSLTAAVQLFFSLVQGLRSLLIVEPPVETSSSQTTFSGVGVPKSSRPSGCAHVAETPPSRQDAALVLGIGFRALRSGITCKNKY